MAVAFTVPQETFRRLVDRVSKVVEKRNTIPILSNVLVAVEDDGRLALTGTDLDATATAHAPADDVKVEEKGATTVPALLLGDILRKLPKGAEVSFTSTGTQAEIRSGRSRFKLHELPAGDFPDIAVQAMPTRFDLTPARLRQIEADVGFAISTEETRYYLNGIYFHPYAAEDAPDARTLCAVATDGHRLSLLRVPVEADITGMTGIIVPRKTVGLFRNIADACPEDEAIAMACGEASIAFEVSDFRLVSKLIDGTFPDYQRVIPRSNELKVEIETEALEAAVDRVSTVSTERGRAIRFAFADGTLTLSMNAPDAGDATDEVPIIEGSEVEIEIGFNGRYVTDALKTFATMRVEMALHDPGSPTLIRKPDDEDRLVVLMPMRV